MNEYSNAEADLRKQAVFESMSPRRQKHILKKGFDKWDPFQVPKDPIDIRTDKTKRTAQQLVREFLQMRSGDAQNNSYNRGVLEMAMGLVNEEDRFRGMYDFALWHRDLLRREGLE